MTKEITKVCLYYVQKVIFTLGLSYYIGQILQANHLLHHRNISKVGKKITLKNGMYVYVCL